MAATHPDGLVQKELSILKQCSDEAAEFSRKQLLQTAKEHLENVRRAHCKNVFVNARLAEALYDTFQAIDDQWEGLPDIGKPWLKGIIRYFSMSTDLEDDMTSPIGLEDDAEILNACLRFAGREDLCIDPEEFDDV